MSSKPCPYCSIEVDSRGYTQHVRKCKELHEKEISSNNEDEIKEVKNMPDEPKDKAKEVKIEPEPEPEPEPKKQVDDFNSCGECGQTFKGKPNFCPRCGAEFA